MGHALLNFWQKNWPGQVMSPSYDVIRRPTTGRFFKEIVFSATGLATCCHWLEWGHYAWFRLANDQMWSWHCTMAFKRSPEVTELVWPHAYNSDYFGVFFLFLEVLRPNKCPICCMDIFVVPLYTIWCQSGPLTQFALRRFCRGGNSVLFWDTACHKYSIKKL